MSCFSYFTDVTLVSEDTDDHFACGDVYIAFGDILRGGFKNASDGKIQGVTDFSLTIVFEIAPRSIHFVYFLTIFGPSP